MRGIRYRETVLEDRVFICPDCGGRYVKGDPEEEYLHKILHRKWKRWTLISPYVRRYKEICEEPCTVAGEILREFNYSLNWNEYPIEKGAAVGHPMFEDYQQKILNTPCFIKYLVNKGYSEEEIDNLRGTEEVLKDIGLHGTALLFQDGFVCVGI